MPTSCASSQPAVCVSVCVFVWVCACVCVSFCLYLFYLSFAHVAHKDVFETHISTDADKATGAALVARAQELAANLSLAPDIKQVRFDLGFGVGVSGYIASRPISSRCVFVDYF